MNHGASCERSADLLPLQHDVQLVLLATRYVSRTMVNSVRQLLRGTPHEKQRQQDLHTNEGHTMNILGVMRIKNEARWIKRSIESQLPICKQVLVLDDHSTDSTRDIVESFGDRCMLIESPFDGCNEGRDKRYLLSQILLLRPDWVLWIDGDEELDKHTRGILFEEAANPIAAWFTLPVLYFWNSETTYRTDGCYSNFHRRSFFRVKDQDPALLHFPTGTGDAELHGGGNCPQGLVGEGYISRARIKHFGYLDAADRQKKYEWYNKIDPNNEAEDCYRHIIEIPGARHAPGPTVLEQWLE